MANSFDSNITRQLARKFLPAFETTRVLSKGVNTQFLQDMPFNPSSGTTIDIKRPTDYVSQRTSGGDISSGAPDNDIVTGKATATVQDYFTVDVEYTRVEQAIKMDQLDELLAPMATRIVTDLEVDFAKYMLKNCALSVGDPDTSVTTWAEVAEAGALMDSVGVPGGPGTRNYCINPYTQTTLAGVQNGLTSVDDLVRPAFVDAVVNSSFAGMRVMKATALGTYGNDDLADRVGTLSATPDATYVTAKDTMTQSLAVTGLTATGTVQAGSIIEVTNNSRNRLNISTKQQIIGNAGGAVKWRAVVTANVTLSGGAGTLVCTGPAIYETGDTSGYNTVSSALASGDAIEILGTASTVYQPNMFFHKDAFCIGSVPIPKLYATDTLLTTNDGLQIRISKFADGLANKQIVRFDFQPAYGTFNPFFAVQGFGNP
jgi:hypothetical protein